MHLQCIGCCRCWFGHSSQRRQWWRRRWWWIPWQCNQLHKLLSIDAIVCVLKSKLHRKSRIQRWCQCRTWWWSVCLSIRIDRHSLWSTSPNFHRIWSPSFRRLWRINRIRCTSLQRFPQDNLRYVRLNFHCRFKKTKKKKTFNIQQPKTNKN